MELTKEQINAYMKVARMEAQRIQKIREQIESNPNMLAKELDLGYTDMKREDLLDYGTVALCELDKIYSLLDDAFGNMEEASQK